MQRGQALKRPQRVALPQDVKRDECRQNRYGGNKQMVPLAKGGGQLPPARNRRNRMECHPDGVRVTFPSSSNYQDADDPFDASDHLRCGRGYRDLIETLKNFDSSAGLRELIAAPKQEKNSQADSEQKQCDSFFVVHRGPPAG
jgi:hypothetical protein